MFMYVISWIKWIGLSIIFILYDNLVVKYYLFVYDYVISSCYVKKFKR